MVFVPESLDEHKRERHRERDAAEVAPAYACQQVGRAFHASSSEQEGRARPLIGSWSSRNSRLSEFRPIQVSGEAG
jgi:hypothetical protein